MPTRSSKKSRSSPKASGQSSDKSQPVSRSSPGAIPTSKSSPPSETSQPPAPETTRSLPERPDLRHLKDQAKDLLRSGGAGSLTDAQFKIARRYGFASWPRVKSHVDSLHEAGRLKQAIDANDLAAVKVMMARNPELHRAPLGYGKNGPLTWVAECRVPWEPPSAARLAMAEWMIDHGSDVHQGGDGPLMRAALLASRIPMMELLVARGADVNALWSGYFPIIFAPCETLEPASIRWLLDHDADPRCWAPRAKYPGTALDYVISTYSRSEQLGECIDVLLAAGCPTRYNIPPLLAMLRGDLDELAKLLEAEASPVDRGYPELAFGATATRSLSLRGATLLHVAAEYGLVEAAKLLLDRGADVNVRAATDGVGVGGQTPIFHAVTQFYDWGLPVARLLIDRGADLTVRAKLPGHYQRPGEVVECTPLEYAQMFPSEPYDNAKTVNMLREGAE
ncbi:MAG TPA: ankyrin repeat domain-containing protein [Candidatus Angelobacter sp.]|nr:ankyrin repeat domain-containing protein [Candidatus Angelobacter sp.]